jgi:hypothetical protein
VLPAIDWDDRPGDMARAVADQERSQSANVVDIHQMVARCRGGSSSDEFVEAVALAARVRIGPGEIA